MLSGPPSFNGELDNPIFWDDEFTTCNPAVPTPSLFRSNPSPPPEFIELDNIMVDCTSRTTTGTTPSLSIFKVFEPIPLEVAIDIKPDSDPNCFNNNGHGVIPVAILGRAAFDATQVDAATVQLEGMAVRAVGRSNKLLAHVEDVNGDGFNDLVFQIEDTDGAFDAGETTATLSGRLKQEFGGAAIVGTDSICIVPDSPRDGAGGASEILFVRGDSNADGAVNISDPASTLEHLFRGGPSLTCEDAADTNDDGTVDVSDAVFSLRFLFLGDRAPAHPLGECGLDLTEDALRCASFRPCR